MSDDELFLSNDESEHKIRVTVKSNRWRASEPPEEVFTESELHREWGYEIIGEEVDENGNIMYEVRWDDWARENGTKTTWNTPSSIDGDNWKKEQKKIRRNTGKESLEIDAISTTDIHNVETYLRHQAYEDKLNRAESMSRKNLLSDLRKVQAKHEEQAESSNVDAENQGSSTLPYPKRNNQRASTRQKSEISLANSVRATSSSSRPSAWRPSPSSSSISSASTSLMSSKSNPYRSTTVNLSPSATTPDQTDSTDIFASSSKKKLDLRKNDPSKKSAHIKQVTECDADNETNMASPSSSLENFRPPKRRRLSDMRSSNAQCSQLGKEWTTLAAQHKAAPIYFINTVDAQPVPPLPPGFLYLESRYQFSSDVPQPACMENFLVKCNSRYCDDAASCDCQAASTLVDDTGTPMLAYTPDGYFTFNVPKGTEVVECNKLCGCSLRACRNRVSQRPRDIPIEVFKTESRGWGVRPLVDVRKGKVLGLYTGLVIPREAAHSLPKHVNSEYVFDLDGDEADDGHPLHHPLFSVDSKFYGNWTRFINHSCGPNLQIYLVVHDIPPANGLPFIAFVALTEIPAKTEFTFDYDPRAAELLKKGKRKMVVPEGAKVCFCGADNCRGLLSL